MKLRQLVLVGLASSLLFITPMTVIAHSEDSMDTSTDSSQTSTDDTSSNDTSGSLKELKQRILERKKEFAQHLSDAEHMHIMAKCTFAQGIVEHHHHMLEERGPKRAAAYGQLDKLLENLIAKLKARDVDTTKLAQERAELNDMAGKIKTGFDTYRQDLDDLMSMDCKSDPAGFKAALEAARDEHKTLLKDLQDFRTYVKETIVSTLKDLRQEIKDKASAKDNQ